MLSVFLQTCAGKAFGHTPPKYAMRTQEHRTQTRMPLITKLHSNCKLTKLQIHGWWDEAVQQFKAMNYAITQFASYSCHVSALPS
jgi:hypothetical protein